MTSPPASSTVATVDTDRVDVDVVVVGGGPAGSTTAALLAKRGLSVLVLEKTRFPRFHLGESLLPWSLDVFEALGVLPALEARFQWKYGARFHDDVSRRTDRFAFANAWRPERDHAFQVPRDEFDQLLLENARTHGADVREGATVTRLVETEGRVTGLVASLAGGESLSVTARFVVDATGRDALTAHRRGTTTKIPDLEQTALFAHFEGIARPEGNLAGDIDIVLFREDPAARANWFWFIPFKDGRTSVGAVVSRAWMRTRRAEVESAGDRTTALFHAAVASSRTARSLLDGARMVWPKAEAAADFSYRVERLHGPGWLSVGDAAGFIDPLFSTGVHLALVGARIAAEAITAAFASPADEAAILAAWETRLRAGAETFILAVGAFYKGPLVDYLFAEDKHDVLRRSITSLLAGDVFGDAVWLRDARRRIAAM